MKPPANAISPVAGSSLRKFHCYLKFKQVIEEWEEEESRVRSRLILSKLSSN